MLYRTKIQVTESISQQDSLLSTEKSYKLKQRINGLILFKEYTDKSQEEMPELFSDINLQYHYKFETVNLYMQDKDRFDLKTQVEKCLNTIVATPIAKYQNTIPNTCIRDSYINYTTLYSLYNWNKTILKIQFNYIIQ